MIITSALVIGIAGACGFAMQAVAADTPDSGPPAMGAGAPPPWPPGPGGWGPGDKHRGMHPGWPPAGWPPAGWPPAGWPPGPGMRPDGWGHHDGTFALFAPVPDKKLTAADVKIIAMAILLEHGNHDWTVTDVTAAPDKTIHFSYATPHGDVVAIFAINPVTGRVTRVG